MLYERVVQSIVRQVQEMREVRERQVLDLQRQLAELEQSKRAELEEKVQLTSFRNFFLELSAYSHKTIYFLHF